MFSVIFVIHLIICVGIIGLVLLQQGKGAEAGAVFGSTSDSVIGAGSAPSFMSRVTTGLAIAFMVTSILLVNVYMKKAVTQKSSAQDVLEGSVLNVQAPEGEDTTAEAKAPAGTAEMKKEAITEEAKAPVVAEVVAPEVTKQVEVPVAPVEVPQPEKTK